MPKYFSESITPTGDKLTLIRTAGRTSRYNVTPAGQNKPAFAVSAMGVSDAVHLSREAGKLPFPDWDTMQQKRIEAARFGEPENFGRKDK